MESPANFYRKDVAQSTAAQRLNSPALRGFIAQRPVE